MCSSSRHFKKLENAIKQTWGSNTHPDIKIIFYTDNQRRLFRKKTPVLKGADLVLPCKDGYINCTEKTLQAFKVVASNFDFDYIFRTNLGSYVSLNKIIAFLNGKPATSFYAGIIGVYKSNNEVIKFASGSGFFLSKDIVQLIISKSTEVDHAIIDDLAFGKFMAAQHININPQATRLSYTDAGTEFQIGAETVSYIDDHLLYHVRLRSADRQSDVNRMHSLFKLNF